MIENYKLTEPLHRWKVVPLSYGQRKDVREEDLIQDGLYRYCDTYRGGGGYDRFPAKAVEHFGGLPNEYRVQFIAQLQGCNLDCPYCYVTRAGVWGAATKRTTRHLVHDFVVAGYAKVFHLMGGAPALQMKHWPELLRELKARAPDAVFHSDLMLSESRYDEDLLKYLATFTRGLYAINIKGLTPEEWELNTRKDFKDYTFWENWRRVQASGLRTYVTITGCDMSNMDTFLREADANGIQYMRWLNDVCYIDIKDYDAQPYVDDIPWGRQRKEKAND